MTFESWVLNRVSPFRRRLKRIRQGKFIPVQMRTRQVYGYAFILLTVIAFFSWILYNFGVMDTFVYFMTHDIPLDLVAFLFAGFWTGIHFWMDTPKAKLGYYPSYTIKNWEKDHKIRGVIDEDEDGKKHVTVLEMDRCGGLADLPFKGNGPIPIAPVLQDDITAELNAKLEEEGDLDDLPPATRQKLSSGVWIGGEYNVPADFHLYLLGNTDDGLGDEFRLWIKQSYRGLSGLCVVMMAWDPIREKSVIGAINPSAHPSNLHWHLADQERYIHFLEERLKMRTKAGKKTEGAERGPQLVFPEEEL